MSYNTTAFIKAVRERINPILPCYYEEASTSGRFPYGVLNGIHVLDLADGDLVSFYLDVWTDENKPDATVELEEICDKLRNGLSSNIINVDGVFMSHISFENCGAVSDGEFDIAHRRLSMSARIFYYQEA